MSVLSNLEKDLGVIETDVVNFFSVTLPNIEHKIESELQTAATFFVTKALPWMEAHGQEIATDLTGVVGIVAAAGVGIPAPVLAASVVLNKGVSLVNDAIAAAQQAAAGGASAIGEAIAAGGAAYAGLKTAQVATSQAQAHVAAGSPAPTS